MKLQGDENKKNIRNTLKSSTFSFLRVKENLILSAEKKRKNNLGCYAPTHSSKDLEQRILEIECSCSCSVIQHCIFSRDLHTQHYVFSKNKALQILRKKGFPALKESRPDHALGFVYRGAYFLEKSPRSPPSLKSIIFPQKQCLGSGRIQGVEYQPKTAKKCPHFWMDHQVLG